MALGEVAGRLVVWDPDGVNPYGRELACLINEVHPVEMFVPVDTEWRPDELTLLPVLPGNRRGAGRWRQATRLVLALVRCCLRSLPRHPVLVLWTRSAAEEIAFSLLTRLGVPVCVVMHQADGRTSLGWARRRTIRHMRRVAARVITHSDALVREISPDAGRNDVSVCMFPPFVRWPQWAGAVRPPGPRGAGKLTLLFLGQLRRDKNVDELHSILAAVPAQLRDRMRLIICGKGLLEDGLRSRLAALVDLDDRRGPDFAPDEAIGQALRDADVLLAPYRGASQSATVVLALCAGLEVLAYDDGSLADFLSDGGLVAAGDREAFAARLAAAVGGEPLGRPRTAIADWSVDSARSWCQALPWRGAAGGALAH